MNKIHISSHNIENNTIRVSEYTAFSVNGKYCLINEYGYMILLDEEMFRIIESDRISNDLKIKLMQRNFISFMDESRSVCKCKAIRPTFFMIDLTKNCNMQCKYCFREVNTTSERLQSDMLHCVCNYIIKYCEENGIKKISIQPWGGEPLLEINSILSMVDIFEKSDIKAYFTIETNGLLLTKQNIEILHTNKIAIGVSLDGSEKFHDLQRVSANGHPTHRIIVSNLKELKKVYKNNFGIINTITKINQDEVENILDYYAKELKIEHVKFNFVHESEFAQNLCIDLSKISELTIRILNKVIELNMSGYVISETNIKHKLLNLLTRGSSDICNSCGCCGGYKMITFDMHGGIYPCELTDYPEECIGNIKNNEQLVDVIRIASDSKPYFLPNMDEECKLCEWQYYCRGGCSIKKKMAKTSRDMVECTINSVLYPELIRLIMEKPKIINQLVGCEILEIKDEKQ